MCAKKYIREEGIFEEESVTKEFSSSSTTAAISSQISDFLLKDKYTICLFKEAHQGARKYKRTEFDLKTAFKIGKVSVDFEIGWKKETRRRKEYVLLHKRIIKPPKKRSKK